MKRLYYSPSSSETRGKHGLRESQYRNAKSNKLYSNLARVKGFATTQKGRDFIVRDKARDIAGSAPVKLDAPDSRALGTRNIIRNRITNVKHLAYTTSRFLGSYVEYLWIRFLYAVVLREDYETEYPSRPQWSG